MLKFNHRTVRKIRKARGLSAAELAKAAKLTERTVNYIEKGYSDPRASSLARIASVLDVPIGTFFVQKEQEAA